MDREETPPSALKKPAMNDLSFTVHRDQFTERFEGRVAAASSQTKAPMQTANVPLLSHADCLGVAV